MASESPHKTAPNRVLQALPYLIALLGASLLFSQSLISLSSSLVLIMLIYGRVTGSIMPSLVIPAYVKASAGLFAASAIISIFVSDNTRLAVHEAGIVLSMALMGLLAGCSMDAKMRRMALGAFYVAAAAAGVMGSMQYFNIVLEPFAGRAHGTMHPVHYGGIISIAAASCIITLVIPNDTFRRTRGQIAFQAITLLPMLAGVLLSQTRGAWLAFVAAGLVVMMFYRIRVALAFALAVTVLGAGIMLASPAMKARVGTIYDALIKREVNIYTLGERVEVWRGALMIFERSPVLGTGSGDFRDDIDGLVRDGSLPELRSGAMSHAHNIYMHWLATQGALGEAGLVMMLASLFVWGAAAATGRRALYGHARAGGYMIIFCAVFAAVWGVSESHLSISKIVSAYCFVMGLGAGLGDARG